MKKTLMKKIVQMAMVVAMLYPPVGSAQDSDTAQQLIGWGGVMAVLGGIVWYVQSDEADDCEAINDRAFANTDPRLIPARCTNQNALNNQAAISGAVAILGGGLMAWGLYADSQNSFQVRAIRNGVAIERDNLSFSTTSTGKVKLQKRWEF